MDVSTLERQTDELLSRAAIGELIAGYCVGCDTVDVERFMSIWHDDATFSLGDLFGDFTGPEGIREGIGVIWDALPATHHWTTNLILTFEDPDHASGRSDVHFECVDTDGKTFTGAATYFDKFERREGTWKFSYRVVDVGYRNVFDVTPYDT